MNGSSTNSLNLDIFASLSQSTQKIAAHHKTEFVYTLCASPSDGYCGCSGEGRPQ